MKFNKSLSLIILILAVIACDMPMGMGDPIDLEAPVCRVTHIELPDGEIKKIEADEQGRIYVGPGILFGAGAALKGKAQDNVSVEEIQVLDVKSGKIWKSREIEITDSEGWQNWSITLEGLEEGEREIEVTAFDRASLSGQPNIGPETMVQLTLIVDINPPIIDRIYIERHTGVFANLLPLSILNNLSPDNYEDINFFQNEKFNIKAEVSHKLSLDEVTLNFLDDDGNLLFSGDGMERTSGSLYTPVWEIDGGVFSAYTSGRHNFRVVVKARAKAGHFGENDITNNLYSLCWMPEADYPHINLLEPAGDTIYKNAGTTIPIQIFDDDNLEELYYDLVIESNWNSYRPAEDDDEKLQYLYENKNDSNLGGRQNTGGQGLNYNRLASLRRNTIESIAVGSNTQNYMLIMFAKDKNQNNSGTVVSKIFKIEVVDTDSMPIELIDIICDNPDNIYNSGSLAFKLLFTGEVKISGGTPSIKFEGGSGGNTGGEVTVNNFTVSSEKNILTGSWDIMGTRHYDPVTITDVSIAGVQREDDKAIGIKTLDTESKNKLINDFNNKRKGLKVLTVTPTVTHINNIEIANNTKANASILTNANNSLTLTFNNPVWPESGTITIRTPGDTDTNYLVPPVLTNAEYGEIIKNITSDQKAVLDGLYKGTTHGLITETRENAKYPGTDVLKNPATGTVFVPDIATKYVLNFSEGLNNSTIREILNDAKFRWREIDVHSTTRSEDGKIITVNFEALPNGQFWYVLISAGAFRDDAGNTNEAYTLTSSNTLNFWSQTTATPVIRVDRVSNNHPTTDPTTNTEAGTKGETDEVTARVAARYRIDCVTPDAEIKYGELEKSSDAITLSMVSIVDYGPRSVPGPQNSNLADAAVSDLTNLDADEDYEGVKTIGDTSLYTARKDYLKAVATRSRLADSAPGYEGAFKTLIVLRNMRPGWDNNNNATATTLNLNQAYPPGIDLNNSTTCYLSMEASNMNGAPVTLSGFPMAYNDMSGKSSKYFYRNRATTGDNACRSITLHNGTTITNNTDWIWISWEIVSPFWINIMVQNDATPNSPLFHHNDYHNSWAYTNESGSYDSNDIEYNEYSYNSYGNWNLRVGHYKTGRE